MDEHSSEILNALQEIRELLRLIAEPAIAERDRKYRQELRRIVGDSEVRAQSTLLMDGSRTQAEIRGESGMNQGNLSAFVQKLKQSKLLSGDGTRPKLIIRIPSAFFESGLDHE